LINITGSSSLKLNEVNEASTIIQNAAHEDANIIFGAVLDETMGDDVKITVIATGFKEAQPERRERMLGSGVPVFETEPAPAPSYSPRISPRVASAPVITEAPSPSSSAPAPAQNQPSASAITTPEPAPIPVVRPSSPVTEASPATAAEADAPKPEPAAPVVAAQPAGSYKPVSNSESRPELVPVPASVFDDEFFRKGNDELRAGAGRVWSQDTPRIADKEPENAPGQWPEARIPSFAGYAGDAPAAPAESDELDIPAFFFFCWFAAV
jgi:cell division protein FtsZ